MNIIHSIRGINQDIVYFACFQIRRQTQQTWQFRGLYTVRIHTKRDIAKYDRRKVPIDGYSMKCISHCIIFGLYFISAGKHSGTKKLTLAVFSC